MRAFLCITAIAVLSLTQFAQAGKHLEGIACRSVHLGYSPGAGSVFYNEVEVSDSAPGSFFMVCGWDTGYYGMQELYDGRKVLIFSVWDSHRHNDPNAVEEDLRTKLVHRHPDMRIGRFGGEGTGGQSFFDYDWQLGETYRFMVRSKVEGERTVYGGFFYHPGQKKWLHLVSFSTVTGGRDMRGFHSFIEDFRRNRVSTTKLRKAVFGNAWVLDANREWKSVGRARFTGDGNPSLNIDAGVFEDRFYLATGGDIENKGVKLWQTVELPEDRERQKPTEL